jgi:hypothetical protein
MHYHYNKLRKVIQSNFTGNKARIKYLSSLVTGLITASSVRLNKISLRLNTGAKHESNYRNLQRFFQKFQADYQQYARFILSSLPKEEKFYLVIDRTNWLFGSRKINILMLGIVYKCNAIPLFWEMLDKGGCSHTRERKQLLGKAIKMLGKERIRALLADREFIGVKWFKFLMDEGVEFHIRIPKQIKKGGSLESSRKTVYNLFRYLPQMHKLDYPKQVNILGYRLLVSGMKSKNGEYCVVVSSKNNINSLSEYQKRWTIENMFGAFKTRGFNFEDTHLKDLERIKKLIFVVSIAYFWSIMTGIWLDNINPIKLKNHGRKSISIFRKGFDYLSFIINNILTYFNEFMTLTKLLSCT